MNEDLLRDLFDEACLLPPAARASLLRDRCDADAELLEELTGLLEAHDAAESDDAWQRSALHNEASHSLVENEPDPPPDTVLGRHRLVALIGSGGMGKVYRAVRADSEYDQVVAIKRIRPGMLDSAEIVARFRSERQILAHLEHPNIARLLEGGADKDGMPYLVMEYVEGVAPLEYCENHRLPVARRLDLFRQICAAVHYAHQRSVVHRDLKPGNILVMADGTPKLLDFGIAKLLDPVPGTTGSPATRTAMHLMTARYSSPEQVRGEPVTTMSDVYSLGVILYELLTSESPYRNTDRPTHELLREVCEEDPRNPGALVPALRGDLENILLKALKKDPQARYSSVDTFSEDLARYRDGRPVVARADTFRYVAAKLVRRNKAVAAAFVLAFVAAVTAFIAIARARDRAERRFNEVREIAHAVIFDYHDAIERLPGATPVRARLVKDSLRYLESLAQEADTPDLQREIIDAYVRIADVQGNSYNSNLGDTAGALRSARKAVATAEKLLVRDRQPKVLQSCAAAFKAQAELLYSAGDLKAAQTSFERAISLEENAEAELRDTASEVELSNDLCKLGDLVGAGGVQSLGDSGRSMSYYRRALSVIEPLAKRLPHDLAVKKELCRVLLSVAGAEMTQGRAAEGARYLQSTILTLEEICAADPNDTPSRTELANASLQLGTALLDARKPADAAGHIGRALEIMNRAALADPSNALMSRNLSVVENQYAAALRGTGDFPAALEHNRRSLALATALSAKSPQSMEFRSDVGIARRKLAETMLTAADAAGAAQNASESVAILCSAAGTAAKDAFLRANCGRALLALGRAQSELNRGAAALQSLRSAQATAAALALSDPANSVWASDLARTEQGLAEALVRSRKYSEAREAYTRSLAAWSKLRAGGSLSAEDASRADRTAAGSAALPPPS
jgi:tetratricopeptide (TPR) repeat protein/tRNA A-37 threonylcarbamoyl transferase component Bud32